MPRAVEPTPIIRIDETGRWWLCPKCNGRATDDSSCPYADEINNDLSPCNCCDVCRRECARDI